MYGRSMGMTYVASKALKVKGIPKSAHKLSCQVPPALAANLLLPAGSPAARTARSVSLVRPALAVRLLSQRRGHARVHGPVRQARRSVSERGWVLGHRRLVVVEGAFRGETHAVRASRARQRVNAGVAVACSHGANATPLCCVYVVAAAAAAAAEGGGGGGGGGRGGKEEIRACLWLSSPPSVMVALLIQTLAQCVSQCGRAIRVPEISRPSCFCSPSAAEVSTGYAI